MISNSKVPNTYMIISWCLYLQFYVQPTINALYLPTFPQCNFVPEFPDILCKNLIYHHLPSKPENYKNKGHNVSSLDICLHAIYLVNNYIYAPTGDDVQTKMALTTAPACQDTMDCSIFAKSACSMSFMKTKCPQHCGLCPGRYYM